MAVCFGLMQIYVDILLLEEGGEAQFNTFHTWVSRLAATTPHLLQRLSWLHVTHDSERRVNLHC